MIVHLKVNMMTRMKKMKRVKAPKTTTTANKGAKTMMVAVASSVVIVRLIIHLDFQSSKNLSNKLNNRNPKTRVNHQTVLTRRITWLCFRKRRPN